MHQNERPLAILLATYNSSLYLREQLDSLLAQTCQDWMVFIRDDGSTDDTLDILRQYQNNDSRFVMIEDDMGNLGPQANFMRLLGEVESDYYMFMDSDDYWLQAKIEKELLLMRQIEVDRTKPALVFCNMKLADSDLYIISDSFWREIRYTPAQFNDLRSHAYISYITGCTMLFNRPARDAALPVAVYSPMHDWWVAHCVYRDHGIVSAVDEPLMLYRKHGGNATGDFVASQRGKSIILRIKEMYRQYRLMQQCGATCGFIDYVRLKYQIRQKQKHLPVDA